MVNLHSLHVSKKNDAKTPVNKTGYCEKSETSEFGEGNMSWTFDILL